MDAALRRAGWICLVTIGIVYAVLSISSYASKMLSPETLGTVVVRDVVHSGEHHMTGMVPVPSTCDELSVTSKKINETEYQLVFETWPEPSVRCMSVPSARLFDTVVFAPSEGAHFSATLDKKPFTIAVYPTYSPQ